MRSAAIVTCALALSGCATNLAEMQTARALKPGELRLSGGAGFYIPASQIGNIAAEGVSVAKQNFQTDADGNHPTLTDNQKRALAVTSLALATMPPAPSFQIDARVGLLDRLDVGVRYSVDSVRADAKLNFYHDGVDDPEDHLPRRSKDLALGFAVSKQVFAPTVGDAMGNVKLDNFDRWDFEVPLIASIDVSRYFGIYGAVRYQFSRIAFDQSVTTVNDCACNTNTAPSATTSKSRTGMDRHFYGGTVGMRVGSARFSWMLELTVGNTTAKAHLLDSDVELGGITVYPATGFALTF